MEIELTRYVKTGGWIVLRESLPSEHPESIDSKIEETEVRE